MATFGEVAEQDEPEQEVAPAEEEVTIEEEAATPNEVTSSSEATSENVVTSPPGFTLIIVVGGVALILILAVIIYGLRKFRRT